MALNLIAHVRWRPPPPGAATWRDCTRWLMAAARHPAKADATAQENAQAAADADAFYELFTRYQKPIADFLFRMTHDRDWAADLTQDTFLKAYAHLEDLHSITNVRAWLYRIAANTASNALRHQRRFVWVSLTEMRSGDSSSSGHGVVLADTEDLATSVVERDALSAALQTLPANARAAILLRATGGFEAHEIASMLNLSEANVRKILYRAKEKLRKILSVSPEAEKGLL
jgi:RNA polymerase sigma-70 factor, ECF subfamily